MDLHMPNYFQNSKNNAREYFQNMIVFENSYIEFCKNKNGNLIILEVLNSDMLTFLNSGILNLWNCEVLKTGHFDILEF